jgi:hypothetical protein
VLLCNCGGKRRASRTILSAARSVDRRTGHVPSEVQPYVGMGGRGVGEGALCPCICRPSSTSPRSGPS